MQALLLPVGEDVYALELRAVREVVAAPVATPVPGAPPAVLGVFNLHGEVVPLLDTARLLDLPGSATAAYVAVADTEGGPAGFAASAMPATARLGRPAGLSDLPAGVARFAVGDRVATLLDPDELVDRL